jgi:catechol 2,3-dioxygenase-like lactoylglutathione lyase family enzyme
MMNSNTDRSSSAVRQSQLTFHHFGLAVRRPEAARVFVSTLGYRLGESVFDPAQNVHLQLCVHDTHPAVEIIWPGETKGPNEKLIECHPAGIIYHVCYETRDLPAALEQFEEAGLRVFCISPPTPAKLFGGRNVSFYKVTGIGLIEILEG